MTLLVYLIKTLLISGLLLGYYWFFLRNKSFHLYNRFLLLGIPVISFVLPCLRLTLPNFWKQSADSPIHLLGVANGTLEEAVTIYARQGFWNSLPWESICIIIGLLVSLSLFFRFYRSLRYLHILRKSNPHQELHGAEIYFVRLEGTPFSFFNSIFWNEEQELSSRQGQQIFRHELYHVRHKHSLDILLLEMARIVCWFNPFFHLIRREIQTIHEFLADAYAAPETDELEYAELLLTSSVHAKSVPITHPFFQNQIKRRIAMITTHKKIKPGLLGRMMVLPVVALLLGLFAFKLQNRPALLLLSSNTIRVVVDAGHGGAESGALANGISEKNINLQIAKKMQQMAKDYNIDVIMTRENDEIPGHAGNLHDDLAYRAALPAKEHADLFVSIHTNGDDGSNAPSGFQIYIPGNTSKVYSGSVKLGSSITGFIGKDYAIAPELKQRNNGILILSQASVPAVLILCGNINKKPDFDFITDDKNQDKIARDILEGIREYSLKTTDYLENPSGPVDTLSREALDKVAPNTIESMNVDKKNNQIYIKFRNGKEAIIIITDEMRKAMDSAAAFKKVEIEAAYPGGPSAWQNYLMHSLKYPEEAVSYQIQGDVPVQFIVETDGSLTHIHAESGPQQLRAESERVVRESGKWIPARNHGKIVRSYRIQPIDFRLKSS
jgi:N-acetylmuramoyl-L-alanine amidase